MHRTARTSIGTALVGVLLSALTACTNSAPEGGESTQDAAIGPAARDVPSPFVASVTDQVAGRLTPEQKEDILKACREGASIPGTGSACRDVIPRDLPPCRPRDDCLVWGRAAVGGDAGVLLVDDAGSDPADDPCEQTSKQRCEGIPIAADVLDALDSAAATGTGTPVSPLTPTSGTTSPSPSPVKTTPVSTQSAVPSASVTPRASPST